MNRFLAGSWQVSGTLSPRRTLDAVACLDELLRAGLATSDALAVAATLPGRQGRALAEVAASVARGHSLGRALEHSRLRLRPGEIAIVFAGEQGGDLAAAVGHLRQLLEEGARLRAEALRGAIYPAGLITVCAAVVVFAGRIVLPAIASANIGAGAQLPVSTRVVLAAAGQLTRTGPPAALLAVVLAAAAAIVARRNPRARLLLGHLALATPFLGRIIAASSRARFYGLAAALLRAGANIDEAIALAARAVSNEPLRLCCARAHALLTRGVPLSHAVARCGLDRTGRDRALLAVAEAGSGYAVCLERLSAVARSEYRHTVGLAMRLVEPAALGAVALVAAVTVLAVYQPLLAAAGAFSRTWP